MNEQKSFDTMKRRTMSSSMAGFPALLNGAATVQSASGGKPLLRNGVRPDGTMAWMPYGQRMKKRP